MKNKNYILILLLIISLFILFYTLFKTKIYTEKFAEKDEDCRVTDWTEWSECDRPCDGGKKIRTRTIISRAKGKGKCVPLFEEENCNNQKCSENDCIVSDWKLDGDCSKSCGGGIQKRKRTVVRKAKPGGFGCPPLISEIGCNRESCPVDCKVSDWTEWTKCSKNCGGGSQFRSRRIIDLPLFEGKECPTNLYEERQCNSQDCPVDCFVSEWSDWSDCSKECGGGKETRTRTVLVQDAFGGKKCPTLTESRECNTQSCPVDCVVGEWGDWTNCTTDCGGGTQMRVRKVITRNKSGGKECPNIVESKTCNNMPCQVDCEVTPWNKWGACSKKCGGGKRTRTRKVKTEPSFKGKTCPPLSETEECNNQMCPINCKVGEWGKWTPCSKECGGGKRSRTRQIEREPEFDGEECPDLVENGNCNIQPCPIDCEVGDWESWSKCSKECGGGKQTRTRGIEVPPQYGGKECPRLEESRNCNRQPCPVDCKVSNWTEFTECSADCGGGTQTRTRSIDINPKYDGEECPELSETVNCNQQPCPVDCGVTDWSPFNACSKECGGGVQQRTRDILVRPKYGGKECPKLVDRVKCNEQPCPKSCKVSDWGPYTKCSKPCGGGKQTRTRRIEQKPKEGGEKCPELTQTIECNMQPCDGSCIVSDWSEWTECTKECGGGERRRTRTVESKYTTGYDICPPLEQVESCNETPCEIGYKPKKKKNEKVNSEERESKAKRGEMAINREEARILENAVRTINDNMSLLSPDHLEKIGVDAAAEFVKIFGMTVGNRFNKPSDNFYVMNEKIENFADKIYEEACGKYVKCREKSIKKKVDTILDLNPVYKEEEDFYMF